MRNVGDFDNMSLLEMTQLAPGLDDLASAEIEIGNISPECYNEDGVYTRVCTQFSWGSKYAVPFSHSNDVTNGVFATLSKLGK